MLKTLSHRLVAILIGAVVLLEEIAWGLLDALHRAVEAVAPLRRLRAWLRRRSRWEALVLFGGLLVLAEGGKLVALALIGTGRFWIGVGVLAALQVGGGVIVVTLWQECRDRLREFRFVAWAERSIQKWRAKVHGWLDRQPLWRAVRSRIRAVRRQVRDWFGSGAST